MPAARTFCAHDNGSNMSSQFAFKDYNHPAYLMPFFQPSVFSTFQHAPASIVSWSMNLPTFQPKTFYRVGIVSIYFLWQNNSSLRIPMILFKKSDCAIHSQNIRSSSFSSFFTVSFIFSWAGFSMPSWRASIFISFKKLRRLLNTSFVIISNDVCFIGVIFKLFSS